MKELIVHTLWVLVQSRIQVTLLFLGLILSEIQMIPKEIHLMLKETLLWFIMTNNAALYPGGILKRPTRRPSRFLTSSIKEELVLYSSHDLHTEP